MMDTTLGYLLCCQSPALFLSAASLLVAYLTGRAHKVRAFFRLLLCILCAAPSPAPTMPEPDCPPAPAAVPDVPPSGEDMTLPVDLVDNNV